MQTTEELSLFLASEDSIRTFLRNNNMQSNDVIRRHAQDTISLIVPSYEYFDSLSVEASNGDILKSGNYKHEPLNDAQKENALYQRGYYSWYMETNEFGVTYLSMYRAVNNIYDISDSMGFLKITLNFNKIAARLFAPHEVQSLGYFVCQPSQGLMFASSNASEIPSDIVQTAIRDAASWSGTSTPVTRNLQTFYITPQSVANTDWSFFTIDYNDYTQNILNTTLRSFIIQIALCLIFCVLLAFVFSTRIMHPINKLKVLMQAVSNEDFSARYETPCEPEIQAVAEEFNRMSHKLDILYNQIYFEKIEVVNARLAAMQAQINPHFLYNTLDTIYWMIKLNKKENAENMISCLSKFLRLTLSADEDGITLLSKEIQQLESYIAIMKYKYDTNVSFHITFDQALSDCKVARFILQPLVENALTHAMDRVGVGEIHVRVFVKDDTLIYEVANTGPAIDAKAINAIIVSPADTTGGFALHNIYKRIQLRYGTGYGLICSMQDGMTVFTLTQPLQR